MRRTQRSSPEAASTAATRGGIYRSVALDDDAGCMFISECQVGDPLEGIFVCGGIHGDKFAVHGAGIYGCAVGRDAEALTHGAVLDTPQGLARRAVYGGHVAVGGHDEDLVADDRGRAVSRAV